MLSDFFDNHRDAAMRWLDTLRDLLDQQEYEFQRLVADLQLVAREIDFIVEHRHMTTDAVETLHTAAVNAKHDTRNSRHELAEAVDHLRETANQLMQLEWRDADR